MFKLLSDQLIRGNLLRWVIASQACPDARWAAAKYLGAKIKR